MLHLDRNYLRGAGAAAGARALARGGGDRGPHRAARRRRRSACWMSLGGPMRRAPATARAVGAAAARAAAGAAPQCPALLDQRRRLSGAAGQAPRGDRRSAAAGAPGCAAAGRLGRRHGAAAGGSAVAACGAAARCRGRRPGAAASRHQLAMAPRAPLCAAGIGRHAPLRSDAHGPLDLERCPRRSPSAHAAAGSGCDRCAAARGARSRACCRRHACRSPCGRVCR